MAQAIVLPKADSEKLSLRWSRNWSLTGRILAVNLFALALMAGGLFFLDSYRTRVISERQDFAERQVLLLRDALGALSPRSKPT